MSQNLEIMYKMLSQITKPGEMNKVFGSSARFAAQISDLLPHEYNTLIKLRQDLKVHHFDLSNAIKDVELTAQSTRDNMSRTIRKMKLRARYVKAKKLKDSTDAKIWKYAFRYMKSDLER